MLGGAAQAKRLVWPLGVELRDEGVEVGLLFQAVPL